MLGIDLERLAFSHAGSGSQLGPVTIRFERAAHSALIGPGGGGKSTLLRLIAGSLKPSSGVIRFGTRDGTALPPHKRPLFFAARDPRFPSRWSVQHILIAALRERDLARDERLAQLEEILERWGLREIQQRKFLDLSESERRRVRLGEIDAVRPPLLLAERLFNSDDQTDLVDLFYRTLRVIGMTALIEVALTEELGYCDMAAVLDRGQLVQLGSPRTVYSAPSSIASAKATGAATILPVSLSGNEVDSPIGRWRVEAPAFRGAGYAVARPTDFELAGPGEESDLILAVEEASFQSGRWRVSGLVSGGTVVIIDLSPEVALHKGKLLPLRFRGADLSLIKRG